MNDTNSGVANSAAKIRSPSFSRSSSSTTITALPDLMSAIACSIESNRTVISTSRLGRARAPTARSALVDPRTRSAPARTASRRRGSSRERSSRLDEPGHVLGEDVHLEIYRVAGLLPAERGGPQRLRDQADLEPVRAYPGHGQRDPVDGDRALLRDVAGKIDRHAEPDEIPGIARRTTDQHPGAVDVALHDVPVQAAVGAHRPLEVHLLCRSQHADDRALEGFSHDVEVQPLAVR